MKHREKAGFFYPIRFLLFCTFCSCFLMLSTKKIQYDSIYFFDRICIEVVQIKMPGFYEWNYCPWPCPCPGAHYCPLSGKPHPQCSSCGFVQDLSRPFCSKTGQRHLPPPEESPFCFYCGWRFDVTPFCHISGQVHEPPLPAEKNKADTWQKEIIQNYKDDLDQKKRGRVDSKE